MTDINENKKEQASFNATRRKMLKSTATVAGIAAVAPAVSFASAQSTPDTMAVKSADNIRSEHQKYISSVLRKYASKSKRIKPEFIEGFAEGFVELNGDIDYKTAFKGLTGEYRLVKLFIRSVNSSRLPV